MHSAPQDAVALVKANPQNCAAALRNALDQLSITRIGRAGDRVIINPNFCGPPPAAKLTDPPVNHSSFTSLPVIEAAIKLTLDSGVNPKRITVVGNPDESTSFDCDAFYRSIGIDQLCRSYGVRFCNLVSADYRQVEMQQGKIMHAFEVAKVVLDADVFINLPIAKTHWLTTISVAYKNIMGIISRASRNGPGMHKTAKNRDEFAQAVLDLYQALPYASNNILHIVDALVAQEGNGPDCGSDVELGALITGRDPFSVDHAATQVMGINMGIVKYLCLALQERPVDYQYFVYGVPFEEIYQRPFALPDH